MSKLKKRSKSPYRIDPVTLAAIAAKAGPAIKAIFAGGKAGAAAGGAKAVGGAKAAGGAKASGASGGNFDFKKMFDLAQNVKKNKDNKKDSYSSINTDGSTETVEKNNAQETSNDIAQATSTLKDYGDIKLVTNSPYGMTDNSHRAAFQMSPYKLNKDKKSLYDMYGSYDPASAGDANLAIFSNTNNPGGNTTSQGTNVPNINASSNNQTLVTNNTNTNNSNVQSSSSGGSSGGSSGSGVIPVQQGTYTTSSGGSSSGGNIASSSSTNQGTGTTTSNIGTGGSSSNINQQVKDARYNKPRVASKIDVTDMKHAGNPIVGKGELGTAIREYVRMGKEKRQEVRAGDITNVSSKYLANQANPVGKGGRIQRVLEGRQKRLNKRKARYMERHNMGNMLTYDGGDVASDDIAGKSYIVKPGSDYIYGRSQGTSQPSGNNQGVTTSNIGNNTSAGAINAMATGTGPGPVNAPKQKRQKKQKTVKQPGTRGSTLGKTPKQKNQKNQGPPTSKQPGTKGSTLGKAMRPGKVERLEKREEKQKFKAAKKLIKQRDADGKVTNYIENAALDTGIALDATEGSTYNKLLGTRAAKKNEADQRGLTVRQFKKGKEMPKRKMKKQIKASDPFIRMGANPGGESGGVHAKDVHLSDLKGKEKRQAKKEIKKAIKGRPGDFQFKAENRLQQMNTIRVGTPAHSKAMKKQAKATAKVEARTEKSEKKLQKKFDKKRGASGGADHGKVSFLKGPSKGADKRITLTLDKTTGKLTRTKKKF